MASVPTHDFTLHQRLDRLAHLYKALVHQHHRKFQPLCARFIGADALVCDVGAHAGQYTKLFAGLARRGRIYAFEPGSYARSILELVVRWHRLGNVTVVAAALAESAGRAVLHVPLKAKGGIGFGLGHLTSRSEQGPTRTDDVEVTTLDAFAATHGFSRLDFLKADIEGWEIRLLLGAMNTLGRWRPAIMLELVEAHLDRAGNRPSEAWDLLRPIGYRAQRIGSGERLETVDGFAGNGDYLFTASS